MKIRLLELFIVLVAGYGLGYMGGLSATTAVKDAAVEVSEEHVDNAADRLSKWADAAEVTASAEYEKYRQKEACEEQESD